MSLGVELLQMKRGYLVRFRHQGGSWLYVVSDYTQLDRPSLLRWFGGSLDGFLDPGVVQITNS